MITKKGSILIFILWVLAFIATFSVAVSYSVRQKLRTIEHLEEREKLRRIADAGVKKAIYVLNQKTSRKNANYLAEKWSVDMASFQRVQMNDGEFSVGYQAGGKTYFGMCDEDGKLDLNIVKSIPIFIRLFQKAANLNTEDAHTIAASISDWRDADDYPDESGAESNYYKFLNPPYAPKSANFDSVEELLYVKGMTQQIYAKVLPYITIDGSGTININTASDVVLSAVGLSDSLIDKIRSYKAGKDGLERTADDRYFKDLSSVASDLAEISELSKEESASLNSFMESGAFSVLSKNFQIRSTASLHKDRSQTLQVFCVADRDGNVLRWTEKFQVT